jgi:hypothetical protein
MPVALVKIADNFSLKQIKGGEQSRRSVPLVIVRHGSATPCLQGQAGLRAVQSLNLAFLIHLARPMAATKGLDTLSCTYDCEGCNFARQERAHARIYCEVWR